MGGRRYLRPRTLFKRWLDAMPPGTIAAEVVTQLSAPGEPLSTAHAVRMLKLAAEHGVPAVLTNAVRYVRRGRSRHRGRPGFRPHPEIPARTLRRPAAPAQRAGLAEIRGPDAPAGQGDHARRRIRGRGPQKAAGPDRGARGPLPDGSGHGHGMETARGSGSLGDRHRRGPAGGADPALRGRDQPAVPRDHREAAEAACAPGWSTNWGSSTAWASPPTS